MAHAKNHLRVIRSPHLAPVAQVEEDLGIHILSVSAMLLGVCVTVIGVIRLVIKQTGLNTLADDLLAFDALLFTLSSLLSYAALRVRRWRRMRHIERIAEVIFVVGLLTMVAICVVIVYDIV
jgi:hypothetical protein